MARKTRWLTSAAMMSWLACGAPAWLVSPAAAQNATPAPSAPKAGPADIAGRVTSAHGPEAGVWVIAETTDLPTRFVRIVATDDQGRYLVPDLPKANYQVWVRGYGLVDSAKTQASPGSQLDLKATLAPDPAAAAQYYPAAYWFAMLNIPDASEFKNAGSVGAKMPKTVRNQYEWLDNLKTNGCVGCHQLGEKATRTIPSALGSFKNGSEAWERRIQSGQAGMDMVTTIARFNVPEALSLFGDWTDRVAKGELPKNTPQRPQGIERNAVVTLWDWGTPTSYLHDAISTDKRHPTVNGYGKIYGTPEFSTDEIPVLDPKTSTVSYVKMPVPDPKTPSEANVPALAPSAYWGAKRIWDSQADMHNAMFDETGRVWFTTRIRPPSKMPAYCKGSDLESAKLSPSSASGRQAAVYDPKSGQFQFIDTCFGAHHLQFAFDKDDTLWFSQGGAGDLVGWLDVKKFDKTHDGEHAQGWTAMVLDTKGTGKQEPGDQRIHGSVYGIAPSPADGSIWGSIRGFPGAIVRISLGDNPPETAMTEFYELPWNDPSEPVHAFGPRGMDIDSNGVVWVPLSSGHLGAFDRRKCKDLKSASQTKTPACPEGWSFYQLPGPQFQSLKEPGSVESSYYTWVDQHNSLGLGDNVPVATGDEMDSLVAFAGGKMISLSVPYPLGFYTKGLDGRIDDPNAGWKGRGLWASLGSRTPFHMETGGGTRPKLAHFQLRPNPLAD